MSQPSQPDLRALKDAFGTFVTGVTVVTTLDIDGTPAGFTASSFTSVSLEPPLLLVCPGRALTCFAEFAACERFAVSVLAHHQRDVSDAFATTGNDRFSLVSWDADPWGCPLIRGAAATFSCATHRRVEAGDHVVLIGRIDAFASTDVGVLGYARGRYLELPARG
jgi:flavin reductase (DIM6/NTAB) family NADH-FMN oxidoreductase RutF